VLNERCEAIKANGERCTASAVTDSSWCWNHDPQYAQARRRNAHRGGKLGGKGRPSPATAELARLQQWFEKLAEDVESDALDKGKAAVMVQALGGARACIQAAIKAREVEELAERMTEIEQRLDQRNRGA
jgi:hypothetical protein